MQIEPVLLWELEEQDRAETEERLQLEQAASVL